jgi:uncharacterized membrane protein YdjX (TVP38/TMEM64 family)
VKGISLLRIAGIVALLSVAAGLVLFLPVKGYLYSFLEWVRQIGPWGPALVVLAYILACVLLVPGSLITLGVGFIFGVVEGTLIVSVSSTLGASAAFLLGRTLAREWIQKKVEASPRFRALDEAVKQQGFKIVLLTRLSPVIPFTLLNYSYGLTKISFRDYVLASWIGMLPGTVMYVYLGSTLKDLADLASGNVEGGVATKILFWAGLAATVVVTVLITWVARNALRKVTRLENQAEESQHTHENNH